MTDKAIVKALKTCSTKGTSCKDCPAFVKVDRSNCRNVLVGSLDIINRQQAEIEKLKIENQSLRSAANSYKIHYDKAVKDFEEFARRAYIDNPFACQYCVHSVANGRACTWKGEHKEDVESCLGKRFKYDSNKTAGETE